MRAASRLILLALGGLAGSPVAAQEIEPVLLEMRLGRYAERIVPAHRAGEAALLPLLQFFDLAEIRARWSSDSTIVAILQPGNRRVTVDPRRRLVNLNGTDTPLAAAEFLLSEGELFLSERVFDQLFGLRWRTSWPDLETALENPENLPIARRLLRETMARVRLRPGDTVVTDGVLREYPRPVEGVVLDYAALVPSDPGPKGGAYSVGLGLNVLGGSLEGRVQNEGPLDLGEVRADISWLKVWRDNKWLSQVRLGDGFSSGSRTRSLRGIALGNVPFRRPDFIGQLPFAGTLGPGWQLEAYRGGRLISFDSVNALGQFSLDVPIQYGENPVDFIAYGPFGEVRQFNRTYRVSTQVIRARRFEYGLSAGACRRADSLQVVVEGDTIRTTVCQATANADLRYGLSTRWTLFGGVDQFWREGLADLFHPYAGITGNLTNAIGLEAEAVANAVLRGAVRVEPSVWYQFAAEASRFDTDVVSPLLTVEDRRTQVTLYSQVWPIPGALRNWLSFDATADWITTDVDRIFSARVGASLQPGQVRFIPSVRWRQAEPLGGGPATRATTYGMNLITLPFPQFGEFAGRLSTRSGFELQSGATVTTAFGFISARVGAGLRAEVGATWRRQENVGFSALFTADLPGVRSYTTLEAPATGSVRATEQVQGSVLYDLGTSAVAFSGGPSLQLGGVSGRVFLDLNGNGTFDTGEYVVPGVRVQVGMYSQETDGEGAYRVWLLPAYERMVASVDTTTLPSPFWIPAYSAVSVNTTPNRFATLNFPLVAGGMAEGTVVRLSGGGTVPVSGARVGFRERRTGRTREAVTFLDGSFYLMAIPPGEWEATIDPQLLTRFGQRADPVRFTIKQVLEGQAVTGVNLIIR